MRELREVFFVDGVRTAFGKAGPKGQFWRTRADDLAVKAVRELLRRNPAVPPERMCAGALTARTAAAGEIACGAADVALAGGVEHMGHHPMGDDVDFNPRFVSERLGDPPAGPPGAP